SALEHGYAVCELARQRGLERVFWHAFLDGRDVPPRSAARNLKEVVAELDQRGATLATIVGRYYAMDRDQRWERTELAYRLLARGEGRPERDPVAAVEAAYARGESDEFVKPIVLVDEEGAPRGPLRDGDAVVFFNFRSDRARQITRALAGLDGV